MRYKSDDIKLVDSIIEFCEDKFSKEERDSEILKFYKLACEAKLYLLASALDEQEYYDKYGNRILCLAKKIGIYSAYDEMVDSVRVRQGKQDDSRPWEEAKKDINNPISVTIELNKRIQDAIDATNQKYEIGMYKLYHRRQRQIKN